MIDVNGVSFLFSFTLGLICSKTLELLWDSPQYGFEKAKEIAIKAFLQVILCCCEAYTCVDFPKWPE